MIVIRFSEISVQKALQIAVKSHWDNTSHQVLHKLVFESMPARLHAVNKAKWEMMVRKKSKILNIYSKKLFESLSNYAEIGWIT